MERSVYHRQVAYKVTIREILNAEHVKGEGWNTSYMKIRSNNVSRVNIMGVVVEGSGEERCLVDDGTGRIGVQRSAYTSVFSKLTVGDPVLVIGMMREFNGERIVFTDILKKLGSIEWIKSRGAELNIKRGTHAEEENKEGVDDAEEKPVEDNDPLPQKVYSLIRSLDKGDGADIEEIITKIPVKGVEKVINSLLEEGEVFEIMPGRIKALD